MIVQMRTRAQAEKVAARTGGVQLSGKPKRDGTPTLSARVDVGADFEAYRAVVEAVSVLFTLFDTDPLTGELGEVGSGWVLRAYQYALDRVGPGGSAAVACNWSWHMFVVTDFPC